MNNAVAVAAGAFHSVALLTDDTVVCWGNNSHGRAMPPTGLGNVVGIASGQYHILGIKSGARIAIVGQPSSQSVALGSEVKSSVAVSSTEPVRYQWRKKGWPIQDAPNWIFPTATGTTNLTLAAPVQLWVDTGVNVHSPDEARRFYRGILK